MPGLAALIEHTEHLRDVALALAALETRYLPKLDHDMVHLKNWDVDGWERYQAGFDRVRVRDWLNYPAARARADAEELLRLAADIGPLTTQLMLSSANKTYDGPQAGHLRVR